jgi:3-deoxy-7-phosphoheptulonate synthase
MVHDDAPTAEARTPDPQRMVDGYHQAAATLNLVRAFTKGGFADLNQVHTWNQEFVATSPEGRRYEVIASEIERALRFMEACGFDLRDAPQLHEVDVWTSHEGLLLDYEEALTRRDSLTGDWYDCSAHMLWVGERTRALDEAHVEFFGGVNNPIGVKLGPAATAEDALALCERLNPQRVPGRLTLIARMGAEEVFELLPPILRAVRDAEHPVVWVSDPMHANIRRTATGRKTRRFEDVLGEIEGFFAACRRERVWPGGVHIEFTGEDVTECTGGSEGVLEEQLDARYMTLCDPRLNARQSLDLAFRVAELMRTV